VVVGEEEYDRVLLTSPQACEVLVAAVVGPKSGVHLSHKSARYKIHNVKSRCEMTL